MATSHLCGCGCFDDWENRPIGRGFFDSDEHANHSRSLPHPLSSKPKPEKRPLQVSKAQRRRLVGLPAIILFLLVLWVYTAYLLAPWLWKFYFQHHPDLANVQRVTHTADGHPGDPLNIGLVGVEPQIIRAMTAVGWYPADPITFRSSVRIAVDSIFRFPDVAAPVSNLYLFGRKQDLAFEQPVGHSPSKRHHVRFWRSRVSEAGLPLWLGAATFGTRVGLSHTTGEITHHIAPNVDSERDRLAEELENGNWAQEVYWIDDFHVRLDRRNGGGDP
jgi:LssY-like putative type I secretion system component LssY